MCLKRRSPFADEESNVKRWGEGNFDEEYWRKYTNHEPKNLKLQTNKKQAITNKHEQGGKHDFLTFTYLIPVLYKLGPELQDDVDQFRTVEPQFNNLRIREIYRMNRKVSTKTKANLDNQVFDTLIHPEIWGQLLKRNPTIRRRWYTACAGCTLRQYHGGLWTFP